MYIYNSYNYPDHYIHSNLQLTISLLSIKILLTYVTHMYIHVIDFAIYRKSGNFQQ